LDSNSIGQNISGSAEYTKMITDVTSTNQSLSTSKTILLVGKDMADGIVTRE
jgi:hypothetical protein